MEQPLDDFTVTGHVMGAAAAMGAAACWALASILFRWAGEHVAPLALNFAKGVVAVVALALLMVVLGWQPATPASYGLLAASGIVGIAIGDTLYFMTLNVLGPRLTLMMTLLVPVTTALGAFWLWAEAPTPWALMGIGMVLFGLGWVLWERAPDGRVRALPLLGLAYASIYILAEAAGILMTKYGVSEMNAAQATLIRQVAAVSVLGIWAGMLGRLRGFMAPLKSRSTALLVLSASLIGAFAGMWLAVFALKYTYAGVAATLSATSPLFILPLGAWLMKEAVSARAIIGVVVAIAGIAVYFFHLS